MAIQEHRCFSIVCDVCKEPLRGEDGGDLHFEDVATAIDNAGYHDWHTTATGAVCYVDDDAAHFQAMREQCAAAEPGHQCWITDEAAAERADAERGTT